MPPPLIYNTYDTAADAVVDAHVRGLLSAAVPLAYNNLTGQFSLAVGNLTAASTKITIGGTGVGALIGLGASVDVNEANLTLSNMGGVLGIAHGGTNNSVAYTAGSVIFSDGTKLTEDNANFFWNDTTNSLCIGTIVQSAALTILGNTGAGVGAGQNAGSIIGGNGGSGATGGTGGSFSVLGGTGGAGAAGAAGDGGAVSIQAGPGGASATVFGGFGGQLTLSSGNGGNSSGIRAGRNAGSVVMTGGTGGTSAARGGGTGGSFAVNGGNGGVSSTGFVAGDGGLCSFFSGGGGNNSSTGNAGNGGVLQFQGGAGGTAAGAGTGGSGGSIQFTGGAAGGGTVGNVGGSLQFNAGQGSVAAANGFILIANTRGLVGLGGTTTPTAKLHIAAGTTAASSAPLKFTSGTNMTNAEAGAIEFTTDDFYATITTGPARKGIVLNDGTNLTSGRIPIATTNGRLTDSSSLTWDGTYGLKAKMIYGNMGGDDMAITVVIAAVSTETVVGAGLSAGALNGFTFATSSLTALVAGIYLVNWSMSLSSVNNNKDISGGVIVNATPQHTTEASAQIINGGKNMTVGGNGIITLAVNDVVALFVENETDADDVTVKHANLSLLRINN